MFDADKLPQFWLLVRHKYPSLSDKDIKVLTAFCENILAQNWISAAAFTNAKY
jgi:hypothetical protein